MTRRLAYGTAQAVILALFFFGLLLGLWAFREDDVRPIVALGAGLKGLILAAVLVVSPAVAVLLRRKGGRLLREDLEEIVARPYPDEYRGVASLALRFPAALFALLWFFVALGLGYGAFGAGALLQWARFEPEPNAVCTIVRVRRQDQQTRLSLECPLPSGTVRARLLAVGDASTGNVGDAVEVRVARGVLGSRWLEEVRAAGQ